MKDDYVAVGVVSVEVVGVNALDNYDVTNVEGSVKGVTPTITGTVVGDTHTAADNRQRRWNLGV
jgi:hypothetical protein